ncbi:mechanosensitive ion channel family protein [Occultella kanbiaonis]|uniref:mechanosensitive ion channel family protein n=1 Tax=Occultella kanbiaonis TaxID=2675754 RepID=UPI0013D8B193|nr:mechanosensitive ion channel domain-containing protein [Occultella kanbiaonis]
MNIAAPDVVAALTGAPLTVLIIIVIASLTTVLVRFLISRTVRGLIATEAKGLLRTPEKFGVAPNPRRKQRLETLRTVLVSTTTALIGSVAVLMILTTLGVNVAPLIASAGVVGIAVAFGAQALVKDVITGGFMLIEDQYGVGDRVELGTGGGILASGVVEEVGLRVTLIRDDDGRRWYVRNGEILRVANLTQGWAFAVVELRVARATDLTLVRTTLSELTTQMRNETLYADVVSHLEPECLINEVTADLVALTWRVRVSADHDQSVASELRHRIAVAFAERGIELAP